MIKFYLALLFLLFCPVIDLSGHFISLPEIYLYVATLVSIKHLKKNPFVPVYLLYFVGFFFVMLFTALTAQASINNHDLFVLRNCAQAICSFFLFDRWFREVGKDQSEESLHRFLLTTLIIASLPCVLVFLQRLDLFGMREIVISLYKPQFHFLGSDEFSSYRYTSVFKDFFTFACYAILLCLTQFYCLLRLRLKGKSRLILLSTLLICFMSQFYVARTSILFIPLLLCACFMFYPSSALKGGFSRKISIFMVVVPLFILSLILLFHFNLVNKEWISSGISILSGAGDESDTSFQVMQEWNIGFYTYLKQNPSLLFIPKHSYDLTVTANPALYTDSFYAQEIYRYGIYGILLYLLYVIRLWRTSRKIHYTLVLFVFTAVVLNYKGGNVFFMHKNSYLYSFFFMLVWWIPRWKEIEDTQSRQRLNQHE